MPSAQNNHYAKVAYFGVAYSDPLQLQNEIKLGRKVDSYVFNANVIMFVGWVDQPYMILMQILGINKKSKKNFF